MESIVDTSMMNAAEAASSEDIVNAWATSGQEMSNAMARGITENSGEVVAAADTVAEEASTSMLTKVKGMMGGGVGTAGGIGIAMMLPMLTGMLPKNIGGTNISGLTSTATTAASVGIGASMMGGTIGALAMPIAGVVGALGLLKIGIDSVSAANREAKNVIEETYGKNSITTSYFGLSSSNLSQFDFSGLIAGVKESTSSIQENKAAVDALTSAYQNATDQMTKDYINQVKNSNYGDLQSMMKARYNTDLAQGMTSKQSIQDLTSIMKAGGKDQLTIGGVLSSVGAKATDNAALGFANALKSALAPYEQKTEAIKKGGYGATLVPKGGPSQSMQAQTLKENAINDIATELLNVAQTTPANLKTIVDGLKSAGNEAGLALTNSEAVFKSLRSQVASSNPDLATWMDQMHKANMPTVEMAKAIALLNAGIVQTPEALGNATDSVTTWINHIEEAFNNLKTQSIGGGGTNPTPTPLPTSTGVFTGTTAEKQLEKTLQGNLDAQNAQLKIAKDALTVQNKISEEAKQQLQYQQQITGLQNDMKTAMISGNYLQAASLKQQISGAAVDFNATSVQQKMQDQVDNLQANADQINQALQDLKDAIGNGTTTIDKTILAAKNISLLNAQSIVAGVGVGAPTVTTIININGSADQKALDAITHAADKGYSSAAGTKVNPQATKISNVRALKKK
jgi:hypothetical protein